jgi:hypothetical protein
VVGAIAFLCWGALSGADIFLAGGFVFLSYVALGAVAGPIFFTGIKVTRDKKWERPLADVILAMSSALAVWLIVDAQRISRGAAVIEVVLPVVFSAGVAGLVYWFLAGRPRPPYVSGTAGS